ASLSRPRGSPRAGARPIEGLTAPGPATPTDGQSSVRHGIIRAARNPHPGGSVGPDASVEINRTAAVIDNSIPDLPTETVGGVARSASGHDDDAPGAIELGGCADVSRLRQCGGGNRCNNQNCC